MSNHITLVTGASGHIGANLVRLLLAEGYQVKALIHIDQKALQGLEIETINCDLLDEAGLIKAFDGVDIVFHCAARIAIYKPMEDGMLKVNIEGTHNVLKAAFKVGIKRLVHFSSIHALSAEPEGEVIDERRPLVTESCKMLYDLSKAEAERLVAKAVADGLNAIIVNPTAVIGPYDFKPSLLGLFILSLSKGGIPALVKGGFNWVDVRDVARGALAAARKGRRGERYLLAGHWKAITDLAQVVCGFQGRRNPRLLLPDGLARMGIPLIELLAMLRGKNPLFTRDSLRTLKHHRLITAQKAFAELGFTARPFSLTIKDTLDWFKKEGYL